MNTERLLRLADYLDTVPAERFDMGWWGSRGPWPERSRLCGTVACAFGHACLIPEFQAAGLSPGWSAAGNLFPTLAGFTGEPGDTFAIAAAFFGLDLRDSFHLFEPDEYVDDREQPASSIRPAEVAARIRELVAKGAAPC